MQSKLNVLNYLNRLFQSKYRSIFGIDITSSSVKILEISKVGDQLCVEKYGRESLPPNAVENHIIKDIDAVAECIKRLMEKLQTDCKHAALAVPDAAIIQKMVQVADGLNAQETEELVAIEADKYIPYPIEEINLDFEVMGRSEKNPALLDVLIVASRAENVNNRVDTLARAGFETKVVDVESYSVERSAKHLARDVPALGTDKTIAIIDIGANYTHLFVLHKMKLAYSRDEKFGGTDLIHAIANHYKMSFEEAATAREKGLLPADYETAVLNPFKDSLFLQIKRTLHFFYSASQQDFVDHILLAGGLARLPGLVDLIQSKLEVNTTVADPFEHMIVGKRVDKELITNEAPALMVACGLALRNIEHYDSH